MLKEVNEFINELLVTKRQNPRSVEVYKKKLLDFANFVGEKTDIHELTTNKIEAFLNTLKNQEYSCQTYNLYLSSIKILLKYLANKYKIADLSKSFKNRKKVKVGTISDDEIVKFLTKIENLNDDTKTLFLLYITLGITFDEISRLKKEDINLLEDGKIGIHLRRDNKYQWLYYITSCNKFGERLKKELSAILIKTKKYIFENHKGLAYTLPNFTYNFKQFKKYIGVKCDSMLNLKSDNLLLKSEIDIDEELHNFIGRRYKIKQRLGGGNNSDVYFAIDTKRNEEVVIKLLKAENTDPQRVLEFKNEFLILKSLDHPLIVKVYDFEYIQKINRHYFTMEYIKLPSLANLKSKINTRTGALIIFQVLNFLTYIKSKNLSFFDISPNNIMFELKDLGNVEIKIIDFGFAGKQITNEVKGTSFFLAPEILINKQSSPSSDIYSLGILIYHLLTQKFPFRAGSLDDYLNFIQKKKMIPISHYLPSISPKFEKILTRMISFEVESRYKTEKEIEKDLEEFFCEEFLIMPDISPAIQIRQARFIGRDKEYELLKNSFNIAFSKNSNKIEHNIFVISGEKGIGKKRLVEELLNHANLSDTNVERLTLAKDDPVESIVDFCNLHKKIDQKKILQDELKIFYNEDSYDRSIVLKKISEILFRIINKEPTILFIDCVSSFSRELIIILKFIMEDLCNSRTPIMIIISFNSDNDGEKPILALEKKERENIKFQNIYLERLLPDQTHLLISSALNRPIQSNLLSYLYEASGGNPGYIMSMLMELHEKKYLGFQDMSVVLKKTPKVKHQEIMDISIDRLKAISYEMRMLIYIVAMYELPVTMGAILQILKRAIHGKTMSELIIDIEFLIKKNYIQLEKEHTTDSEPNIQDSTIIKLQDEYLKEAIGKLVLKKERILIHKTIADHLGLFYIANIEYKEMVAHHLLMAEQNMVAISYYIEIARQRYENGLIEKAAKIYELIITSLGSTDSREKEQINRGALIQLGSIKLLMGDYTGAENCFTRVKTEQSDIATKIEILKKMGEINHKRGMYEKAIEYFDKAILEANENELKTTADELSTYKISLLISRSRFNEVREMINGALASGSLSDTLRMKIYNLLGLVNFYENDLENAINNFNLSLEFATRNNDLQGMLTAEGNIGLVLSQKSKFDEAINWYLKAIKLIESKSDILAKANTLQNLGSCYLRMGKLNDTLKCYEESYNIFQILDKPNQTESALFNLGLVHLELGDSDRALKYAEESLKLATGRGELVIAYNYALFGDIYYSRNDFEVALTWHKKACEIFKKLNINQSISESLISMAYCESELGITKNLDNYLTSAIKTSKDDIKIFVESMILYAKISFKEKNINLPKEALDKIEETDVDNLPYTTRVAYYEIFARFYTYTGNNKKREEYYSKLDLLINRLFSNIPDSMHSTFTNNPRIKTAKELLYDLRIKEDGFTDTNKLERLIEITLNLTSCLDIKGLINLILDNAILFSNAKRGFILLDEMGELKVAKARNFSKDDIDECVVLVSKTIFKESLKSDKIIHIENALESFQGEDSIQRAKLKSVITFPIIVNEKIIGVIYLDDPTRVSAFSDIDKRLMLTFAKQISIAISNSLFLSKLDAQNKNKDIQIKKLIENLSATEEQFNKTRDALLFKERRESTAYDFKNIITKSPKMEKIFGTIERVKDSDFPVLITGESGVGKELIARAIHYSGGRNKEPFFAENCGAFTETLLESELFGYVRGAFTGATSDRMGIFELAGDGTIFLDEIGEMNNDTQKRFLRVIQEKEVRRVGGDRAIKVNSRVICATNRDISKMISDGTFREDLYYRLSVIEIKVPPLRERREDIPLLIRHFIKKHEKGEAREFSKGLIDYFKKYDWPGNIRELENDVVRLLTLSDSVIIDEKDLAENRMMDIKC